VVPTRNSLSFAEPVGAVLTDHELVAQYMACVGQMFAGNEAGTKRQATAAVRHFLQYKVVTHFAYEEEYVLPALLQARSTKKVARVIGQLQAEHRVLLQKADRLDAMLKTPPVARNNDQSLHHALRGFFHDLERHAALENELFPSLL
jgi:iron-sulfur cluster repair protein YtfE (RIC family)